MDIQKALKVTGGREAIIKLADALIKKAGLNAVTQFDESVPSMAQTSQDAASGTSVAGTAMGVPEQAQQEQVPQEEIVAQPIDNGMVDPAQAGMMAAQEFMAPIMEAAMNGDPNAQQMIVQAASRIAQDASQAAAGEQQMMMGDQQEVGPDGMSMDQGMVGPDGMPMDQGQPEIYQDEAGNLVDANGNPVDEQGNPIQEASPEEQVADQIIPESGPQAPVGEESGKAKDKKKTDGVQTDNDRDAKKLASLNINQLKAIIGLARMGRI